VVDGALPRDHEVALTERGEEVIETLGVVGGGHHRPLQLVLGDEVRQLLIVHSGR